MGRRRECTEHRLAGRRATRGARLKPNVGRHARVIGGGFDDHKAAIHEHIRECCDALLAYIKEVESLHPDRWSGSEIKKALDINFVAVPRANTPRGKRMVLRDPRPHARGSRSAPIRTPRKPLLLQVGDFLTDRIVCRPTIRCSGRAASGAPLNENVVRHKHRLHRGDSP